jgi:transcriptional regulator with XRE-family HTH domain
MNRFEQRLQKRMRDPEFAEGYRQMEAELQLLDAIEKIRAAQHISKESLANQMGKKRETVSRLLNDDESNPTLETLIELLSAMGITADIKLRPSQEGEAPIKVTVEPALT